MFYFRSLELLLFVAAEGLLLMAPMLVLRSFRCSGSLLSHSRSQQILHFARQQLHAPLAPLVRQALKQDPWNERLAACLEHSRA